MTSIDDILKSKLEHYESPVSAHIWPQVESNISKPRKRNKFLWLAGITTLGLLLLLTYTGIDINQNTSEKTISKELQSFSAEISTTHNQDNLKSITKSSNINNITDNSNNINTLTTQSSSIHSNKKSSTFRNKERFQTTSNSSILAKKSLRLSERLTNNQEYTYSENDINNIPIDKLSLDEYLETKNSQASSSFNQKILILDIPRLSLEPFRLEATALSPMIPKPDPVVCPPFGKLSNNWSIDLFITPELPLRSLSTTSTETNPYLSARKIQNQPSFHIRLASDWAIILQQIYP